MRKLYCFPTEIIFNDAVELLHVKNIQHDWFLGVIRGNQLKLQTVYQQSVYEVRWPTLDFYIVVSLENAPNIKDE